MFPMETEEMDYETDINGMKMRLFFIRETSEDGKCVRRGVDVLSFDDYDSMAVIELEIKQDEFPATAEKYMVTLGVTAEIDREIEMGTIEETFSVRRKDEGKTCPDLLVFKIDEHLGRIVKAIEAYLENRDIISDIGEDLEMLWVRTLTDEKKLYYVLEDMREDYDFDVFYRVITKMAEEMKILLKEE